MNDGLYEGIGKGKRGSIGRFAYYVAETTQMVTPPSWAKYVSIFVCGGGGGGGGGRLGVSTGATGGGGGGGAGSKYLKRVPLYAYAFFGHATFDVTIGAGGTGGAGSTVDGTNGTNGTGGGSTTVRTLGQNQHSTIYIQSIANGGGAGSGGTATSGGSATGGQGTDCVVGGLGGNANAATGNFPSPPTNVPHLFYAPQGGAPGQAKGSAGGIGYGYLPPMRIGVSAVSTGITPLPLGSEGESAYVRYRTIYSQALNDLVSAPASDELWFTTIFGGWGGTGGDTTTGSNGGTGGAGWRGTGGGGGGGAGVAGFVGGTGGAGGNGVAIFFWEES